MGASDTTIYEVEYQNLVGEWISESFWEDKGQAEDWAKKFSRARVLPHKLFRRVRRPEESPVAVMLGTPDIMKEKP